MKKINIWTSTAFLIFCSYMLFLIFPLLRLLKESFLYENQYSLNHFREFFSQQYYYQTLSNSLKVTILVTILSCVIALPLAYFMTMYKIKGSVYIQILILISSMSPPFIGAYSWVLLFGRSGAVTKSLRSIGIKMFDIYGFKGILIVLTLQLVPLIYMYLMGTLKNIDNSLLEASENLGCTGIRRVFKVIIPLIIPAMLSGSLLVFVRALADFGTPMLIGEGYQTIPVLIFNQFIGEMGGDAGFAAAISVIVIILSICIFFIQRYLAKKNAFALNALNPIEPVKEKGIKNILIHTFIYIYVALAVVPQLYVVYTSFLKTRGNIFVKGYSFDSYIKSFDKLGNSIYNTFVYGALAVVIVLILGVLIAYISVKKRNLFTLALDTTAMLPYMVPGSILGIALLIAFNKKPLLLSGTSFIMVLSYVIRRVTYTVRSSTAALYQISPSIEEAAYSLGASNTKTFIKIILPMMKAGIISGVVLSWISIITELSTTILLYNSRTKTITVAVYSEVLRGNYGIAAALSTILIVLTVISLFAFFKLTGSKEISI